MKHQKFGDSNSLDKFLAGPPVLEYGQMTELMVHNVIKKAKDMGFERVHFQKTGNQEDDLKKLTQKMLAGLEKMIRRHPEQYFWMHKRWRTRPQDDSSSPY